MAEIIGGHNPDDVDYTKAQKFVPGTGQDPARYLIGPGSITGPGQHSAGNLRHARPYIVNGNKLFGFPVGPEGFTRSGSAAIGTHRVIGGRVAKAQTTHFEEGRIELSGTFPGTSSQDKMDACVEILTTPQQNGMQLYLPGVFDILYVLPENWNFTHDKEDRTHSIDYTISFLIIGFGKKIADPKGKPAQQNPTIKKIPKGKPVHIVTVRAGARTLQALARIVYKDADQWQKLVKLNQGQLNDWKRDHPSTPNHSLPTYRWPIGTKFRY